MIVIKIWQLVAAIVVLFIGVYFIVEYRINKNNLIVSEFIIIKDKKMNVMLLFDIWLYIVF